jgi:hypothetical protein
MREAFERSKSASTSRTSALLIAERRADTGERRCNICSKTGGAAHELRHEH